MRLGDFGVFCSELERRKFQTEGVQVASGMEDVAFACKRKWTTEPGSQFGGAQAHGRLDFAGTVEFLCG